MFDISNYLQKDSRYKYNFFLDSNLVCKDKKFLEFIKNKIKHENKQIVCVGHDSFSIINSFYNNCCLITIKEKEKIKIHERPSNNFLIFKNVVSKGNSLKICIDELKKIGCYTNKLFSLLDLNLSYFNKEISYEWLFQIDLSKEI